MCMASERYHELVESNSTMYMLLRMDRCSQLLQHVGPARYGPFKGCQLQQLWSLTLDEQRRQKTQERFLLVSICLARSVVIACLRTHKTDAEIFLQSLACEKSQDSS